VSRSAGFHIKLPFIDRVDIINVAKVRTLEFGFRTEKPGIRTKYSALDYPQESEMLTGDMNIVDIDFVVQYKIGSASDFIFNVRNPENALRAASEAVMRQLIGDRGFNEILTSKETLSYSQDNLEIEARDQIQKLMDAYGSGISVIYVKAKAITPPQKVIAAWDNVNKAQQYKEEMSNRARQMYNRAIPNASGQADKIVSRAQAYAIQRTNRAEGEKEKFLSILKEYRLVPDITRRRIFLETMETILTQIDEKIIIDQDVSRNIFNLLNLNAK